MSEKNIHPDTLTKVGGYNISDIIIINSLGEKEKIPNGVWTELNIYEDINNNAMTGSLEIFDSYNFVSNHELQGNERLVFNLSTPGRQDFENAVVDASEETGFPFYIYGISDRKLQRENIMTYTIFFCSNELARNTKQELIVP